MIQDYDKKQNPFKVPENYFGNFNKEIMTKLPEKIENETRTIPFRKRVLSWSAAAAILAAMIVSGSVFWKNAPNRGNAGLTAGVYILNEEEYYESMEAKSIELTYQELFYSEYGYY